MIYFTSDFAQFFKDLEKHNNREWFNKNKNRYEESVKNPFRNLVEGLMGGLADSFPNLTIGRKDAIFRIHRDVRFSKDKTPYKIHASALISEGGKKDKTKPGFYIQANHTDVRVYSGCHMLDKNQLTQVRSHIASESELFNKLISDKNFVDTFGQILGEKNKRLPPEFASIEKDLQLIANKSFYYFFKLQPKVLIENNLVDKLVEKYQIAEPVNEFFNEALEPK